MSFTLGIDTTGAVGGLAILSAGRLLAACDLGPPGHQAERILGELEALLHEQSLTPGDLDLIVVATGPGSFAGVRIGMAAAQGLGFSLGKPVVGVTSLEILASWADEVSEGRCDALIPLIDARRGEVFAAVYAPASGDLTELAAPVALAPDAVTAFVEAAAGAPAAKTPAGPAAGTASTGSVLVFCGDGVPHVAAELAAWGRPFQSIFPPRTADRVRIAAALGLRRFAAQGAGAAPEPLYIREADARKPARPQAAAAGLFPAEKEPTPGKGTP